MRRRLQLPSLMESNARLSAPVAGDGQYPALAVLILVVVVGLASLACLSPRSPEEPVPEFGGPQYSALMVSSDLARGHNQVAFALVDRDNTPVAADVAQVAPLYTPRGAIEPETRPTVSANFQPWPPEGSGRGVYAAEVEFDVAGDATAENPGLWELRITATTTDGQQLETTTAIRVAQEPSTPVIGAPAPASVTPTVNDVPELAHITSDPQPDPDLYRLSIHEALKEAKPLVVVFSTPAFCVSATCGPQLEVLGAMKEQYGEQANFIHVEVFQDPHLIEGNRFSARQAPAVEEWGLPTEPWTFVVDANGIVRAKFEQFTSGETLQAALEAVLESAL